MRKINGAKLYLAIRFILFILLSITFNSSKSFSSTSADTAGYKYFPLSIGNKLVYEYYKTYWSNTQPTRYESGTKAILILKDTIFNNGKKYFAISGLIGVNTSQSNWYRMDSITGSLMNYNSNNPCSYYYETLADSLGAVPWDSVKNCMGVQHPNNVNFCYNISDTNIFGISSSVKKFFRVNTAVGISITNLYRYYSKNFGPVFYKSSTAYYGTINYGDTTYYRLKGCMINGGLYGDTTQKVISNITQLQNIIPENYSLNQNYPNPFNPTTNIEFEVSSKSNVKLIIYDALGKELAVLVNENLNEGSYNYKWDAINFPSGVYFYRIETDNFTDTKRMVLLK